MNHLDMRGHYRPTLLNTLRAMAFMNWTIWRDYRHSKRLARRRRQASRQADRYVLPTVTPPSRAASNMVLLTMASALVSVLCLGLSAADGWPWLFAMLGVK